MEIKMEQTYTLNIEKDDYPENPRKWDNIGKMVCSHSRYDLGDEHCCDANSVLDHIASEVLESDMIDAWKNNNRFSDEDIIDLIKEEAAILPLYLYDHSGITMKTTPFNDSWDSGQVGYIYVTYADLAKEHGIDNSYLKNNTEWAGGRDLIKVAHDMLDGEVETYDIYLRGDVYSFNWEKLDEDGNLLESDSCSGFFGDNLKENGLISHLPDELKEAMEKENYINVCDFNGEATFKVNDGLPSLSEKQKEYLNKIKNLPEMSLKDIIGNIVGEDFDNWNNTKNKGIDSIDKMVDFVKTGYSPASPDYVLEMIEKEINDFEIQSFLSEKENAGYKFSTDENGKIITAYQDESLNTNTKLG